MQDSGFLVTRVEDVLNWARKNSAWYLLFGTACCAIELMQTGGPRTDLERFGMTPRASPRQADLIIVAGTVTYKMATRIKTLYDQMPEPKYVISMGSCSNCGGLFQLAYSVLKGIDQVIPVDIYVPGCPPRPEALLEGIMKVQERMQQEHGWLRRLWNRKRGPVIESTRAKGPIGELTSAQDTMAKDTMAKDTMAKDATEQQLGQESGTDT